MEERADVAEDVAGSVWVLTNLFKCHEKDIVKAIETSMHQYAYHALLLYFDSLFIRGGSFDTTFGNSERLYNIFMHRSECFSSFSAPGVRPFILGAYNVINHAQFNHDWAVKSKSLFMFI